MPRISNAVAATLLTLVVAGGGCKDFGKSQSTADASRDQAQPRNDGAEDLSSSGSLDTKADIPATGTGGGTGTATGDSGSGGIVGTGGLGGAPVIGAGGSGTGGNATSAGTGGAPPVCSGTTPKQCSPGVCIPSNGCCAASECSVNAGGQTGTCDTGTHTCNYSCIGQTKSCTTNGSTVCIPPMACCSNTECPTNAGGQTGTCNTATHACSYSCTGATKDCTTNGATICIPMAGCCSNTNCPTNAGGQTGTCDSAIHTCSYACSGATKSCTTNGMTICIPMTGCCANADCSAQCTSCDATTHACVPVKNGTDPNNRCAGTCDAAGVCKSKQGQMCTTTAGGCAAGTNCVDGYCCDTSCTGSCMACDIAGKQGTCSPIPARAAPHGARTACAGQSTTCAGSCDGAGACSYPTTSCGGGTCAGTGTCQSGVCAGMQPVVCNSPPACKVSTTCSAGQCNYSENAQNGTRDSRCAPGMPYCLSGACVQCVSDQECALPTPSCHPNTHRCVCRIPSPKTAGNTGNLLKNPGFDRSFDGWMNFAEVLAPDSEGCDGSNSVYVENGENDPQQCFTISAGSQYFVGGRYKGGLGPFIRIHYFDGAGCTGNLFDSFNFELPTESDWTAASATFVPPPNTQSASLGYYGLRSYVDQLYVGSSNHF